MGGWSKIWSGYFNRTDKSTAKCYVDTCDQFWQDPIVSSNGDNNFSR
jgi:hypothetical protein